MTFQYSSLLPGERFEVRNFLQQSFDKWLENCEVVTEDQKQCSTEEGPTSVTVIEDQSPKDSGFPNCLKPKTMKDIEDDLKAIENPQTFSLNPNRKRSRLEEDKKIPDNLVKLLSSKSYLEYPQSRPTRVAGEDCDNTQDMSLALLSVRFFKPLCKNQFGKTIRNRQLTLDKEFVMLSCQRLSVLRDSYCCVGDLIVHEDYSDK